MSTVSSKIIYNFTRNQAAKALNVSVRTVDRYVDSGRLSSERVNSRVWLSKNEVLGLLAGDNAGKRTIKDVDTSRQGVDNLSRQYVDTDVDSVDVVNIDNVDIVSTSDKVKNNDSNDFYEKLYLSTKKELDQKQERLEIANYRVGQLEAQIRNSISLLEYHQQNDNDFKRYHELEKVIATEQIQIEKLQRKVKYEVFNKRLFVVLLLFLLALQPLWLLLIYK